MQILSYSHVIDQWPIFAFYDKETIMTLVQMAADICETTEAPLEPTIDTIAAKLEAELGHPSEC